MLAFIISGNVAFQPILKFLIYQRRITRTGSRKIETNGKRKQIFYTEQALYNCSFSTTVGKHV